MNINDYLTAVTTQKVLEEKLAKARAKRNQNQAKVTRLEADLADAKAAVARASWPKEPTMDRGRMMGNPILPVVQFQRTGRDGRTYTYAALRVENPAPGSNDRGPWYVTGPDQHGLTWDDLLEMMGPEGRGSLIVAGASWRMAR
ncbi:hypothetical protein PBI_MORRISSEY_34 [Gordonia phage Morrissey]|nr:hypothetical protein PBI_MORRISSEY_34 [Gordonia phage Morrissey]